MNKSMTFALLLVSTLTLVACGGDDPPATSEEASTSEWTAPSELEGQLEAGTRRRVLKDATTTIALQLNPETVFCSALSYSALFLKVSVPDLDWLAHFDHRAEGTGLPCAAAGACNSPQTPDEVLKRNPKVLLTKVRVVLTETLAINANTNTCTRQLDEQVTVPMNGSTLKHQVKGDATPVPLEVCQALVGAK